MRRLDCSALGISAPVAQIVGQPILAAAGFQPAPGVSTFRHGFPDGSTAHRPGRGLCLVSGHGFSRAVGGSQFRALAPAAFLLATYVKQEGNSSGLSTSPAFTGFAAMYSRCL